jgi:diguanylate cyclase (GGDEF)-like protein
MYRLRIRQLVKQRQALEALVVARTAELKESNERLANLSMTDGLTGIANRRRFDEVLASEWNRAKRTQHPISVAMLDVDWFKKYNDHYGHQAGDECLRQIAKTFAANVRRAGDLAARYGGEEFVLIAPGSDRAEVMNVAAAIQHALERLELPHAVSPYGRVTASIGVASVIPAEHDSPDALLKKADEALYQAKEQGRNRAIAESAGVLRNY